MTGDPVYLAHTAHPAGCRVVAVNQDGSLPESFYTHRCLAKEESA